MEKFYVVLISHCTLVFLLLQSIHYSLLFFAAHFVERIAVLATCLIIMLLTFKYTKRWCFQDEIDVKKKAVLITGCDSGLGYLLAKQLDRKGFKVFASCLFPFGPGARDLNLILSERSKVFGLDVRKQESVLEALEFIKENIGSYELWAVVNSAEIHKGFSLDLSSLQDFENCMDVNIIGHVRVTKTFLNLLRPSKGRIVNVNSIYSRYPMPGDISYCMSKYAAVAFNDCLRNELASTGIKVISVETTTFPSQITQMDDIKRKLEEKIAENKDEILKNYGKDYIRNYKKLCDFYKRNSLKDDHVAINDLVHAICNQYPEHIYSSCPVVNSIKYLKMQALLQSRDTLYRSIPPIFKDVVRL